MSQQLKVILIFIGVEALARLIAQFDGPFVLLGGAIMIGGVIGLIVWIRRNYQRERPKPPWPPDPPQAAEDD